MFFGPHSSQFVSPEEQKRRDEEKKRQEERKLAEMGDREAVQRALEEMMHGQLEIPLVSSLFGPCEDFLPSLCCNFGYEVMEISLLSLSVRETKLLDQVLERPEWMMRPVDEMTEEEQRKLKEWEESHKRLEVCVDHLSVLGVYFECQALLFVLF